MTIEELLIPFGISANQVKKLEGYGSLNYKITSSTGVKYVLKHYLNTDEAKLVQAENEVLNCLDSFTEVKTPKVFLSKENDLLHQYPDGSFARLLSFIPGSFLAEVDHTDELIASFGESTARFNLEIEAELNDVIAARIQVWDLKHCLLNVPKLGFIKDHAKRKIPHFFFDQYKEFVQSQVPNLKHQIIHNDLNDWNVLVEKGKISGYIDFGDIAFAPRINEVAIALSYLLMNKKNPLAVVKTFISAYQKINSLTKLELSLLYYLIPARLSTSVCNSAEAKSNSEDTSYILVSEKPAWELLEKWISFNPIEVQNTCLIAAGLKAGEIDETKVQENRKKHFSKALKLSYDQPIYMQSAAFQFMFDQKGNSYLDAYNNIPIVGHCHPKISEAVSQQIRKLNTNTRYHYDALTQYADQLLALFPSSLNKVFFVNSGSAASDLAIRLAETYNASNHHLVLEHGYHGNTMASIDVSSYKFDGKGGSGEKSFITTLHLPKEYNGSFQTAQEYLGNAKETIDSSIDSGIIPSSFIAEPISGCGGQVPLINGYLKGLRSYLKKKKILYISDEVQTGFGRMGTHFWGFELHEVVPDIVILGKPMGNGHPIGAVVCTTEIAEKFNNGMEFFSSFGGNPISCVVGKTVLGVIEEEGLQQNAMEVGEYWLNSLKQLQAKFPSIGDVRGKGLFLGIEMIDEREQPNSHLAKAIKNRMKEQFVLCSTDGPHNNVIKVKPPLCFNKSNVDEFISKMDDILGK